MLVLNKKWFGFLLVRKKRLHFNSAHYQDTNNSPKLNHETMKKGRDVSLSSKFSFTVQAE